uniref:Ovule protein n=2 Tax=Panagrolaimus sp. JU765 TaxID=591449 RepID=A0AC34QQI2_9BILA
MKTNQEAKKRVLPLFAVSTSSLPMETTTKKADDFPAKFFILEFFIREKKYLQQFYKISSPGCCLKESFTKNCQQIQESTENQSMIKKIGKKRFF